MCFLVGIEDRQLKILVKIPIMYMHLLYTLFYPSNYSNFPHRLRTSIYQSTYRTSDFLTFINVTPKLQIAQKWYLYFQKLEFMTILKIWITFMIFLPQVTDLHISKYVHLDIAPSFTVSICPSVTQWGKCVSWLKLKIDSWKF